MVVEAKGGESQELKCLADTIYHEGRSLSDIEQKMIGQVVLNRMANNRFPKTVCGVVYHKAPGKNKRFIRQFSWTSNKNIVKEKGPYNKAVSYAEKLLQGNNGKPITSALFFSKGKYKCGGKSLCHRFR
jgi:spore germination cell wall hydrolase CwlJ-like protein